MLFDVDEAELLTIVQQHAGPGPVTSMSFEDVGAELATAVEPSERGLGFADGLWDRIKAEFHELVCGSSERYADLREKFKGLNSRGTTAIVSFISAGLATKIGLSATVAAPIVALLMLAVVRLGKEVFCSLKNLDNSVSAED